MLKINYIGIIANADSSILDLKLDYGFMFACMDANEALGLIAPLENLSNISRTPTHESFISNLFFRCSNFQDNRFYVIKNAFDVDSFTFDNEIKNIAHIHCRSFLGVKFTRFWFKESLYLYKLFKLMNLYKDGSISLLLSYYYSFENNHYVLHEKTGEFPYQEVGTRDDSIIYKLHKDEINILEEFISNTKWPFHDESLNLAYSNFETSFVLDYQNDNYNLSFLSLFLCLEVLFNPGGHNNITHKICRNCAMLLGADIEEKLKIYDDMSYLYNRRSEIVHHGKTQLSKLDMTMLRNYARQSIKEYYKIGKTKEEILKQFKLQNYDNINWKRKNHS